MKKKLVLITGPAGVGKTTVSRQLFKQIHGCAWLDGDWCWMVNPYPGKTDTQKEYVEKAFGYILDGYLNDINTNTILFSWLMHGNSMFDLVTNHLKYSDYKSYRVALICDEREYIRRMIADNRHEEAIRNHDAMEQYSALDAVKIDTTELSISDVVGKIIAILQ